MKTIKNLTADQLRKSILQLAIEGKLVKQDPNDEPASELVKKIMAEKKKLIQEGKIKKGKNESYIFKGEDNFYYEKIGNGEPVKLEDLPFDIPDSWTWIRLKDLIQIQTGASFKKDQAIQENKSGYIRILRGGNILPFQYKLKDDDLFISQTLISKNVFLRKNDLITPAVTSLENVGKIAVINDELNSVAAGGFVYIFRPYLNNSVISILICNFMSSCVFQTILKEITKKSGQAFYNMNKEKLLQLYFPLPPLAEQQRIVDRMAFIEPLLAKYDSIEKKLSALEAEFPERLKKSILQYAIEGKLVKQDPNDEPASVLLERIKAEKERLIKEGKIKRDKNESYVYQGDDKNYYEKVPDNWCIVPLKSICKVKGGKRIPVGEKFSSKVTNYMYLRIADMKNHTIVGCAYISEKIFNVIKNYRIYDDEIYITVAGTIGYVGTIPKYYSGANLTENADKLLLNQSIYKPWFVQYLCSEICQKQIKNCTTKVGQPKLAIKRIEDFFILLPPTEEQKRIYRKTITLLNYL